MSEGGSTMKSKAERLRFALLTLALAAAAASLPAQQNENVPTLAELEKHIDAMAVRFESMRQELMESRNEVQAMRIELSALRRELDEKNANATDTVSALRTSVERLQETSDVVAAEVKQQDQTKVETASKFPVRISGSILFTSLLNSGETNNIDVPVVALPPQPNQPQGSLSATARQTILGLDASGPHFGGASSAAALSVDFFGGIPYSDTTTAAGLVRLRTAHATLAWPDRALTVSFDQPILSPRAPTSWITLGEPALAWSGNLWTWSPQLKFTQTLPRGWAGTLALIDPAAPGASGSTGLRTPDPAEKSRQPGYEAYVGNTILAGQRTIEWGAGGYYSRQAFSYGEHLDAWAATADWKMRLAAPLEISGTFYRGRGIGGLGGGAFKDYVPYNNYGDRRGLDDEGGWGQVKWTFSPVLEANGAAGEDNAFAGELRGSDYVTEQDVYQNLARNLTAYGNFVYRPRAYLLFSAEYRQIRSWPIAGSAANNHLFGVAAGYLF
jgi:regulator of replication initiation timing